MHFNFLELWKSLVLAMVTKLKYCVVTIIIEYKWIASQRSIIYYDMI